MASGCELQEFISKALGIGTFPVLDKKYGIVIGDICDIKTMRIAKQWIESN